MIKNHDYFTHYSPERESLVTFYTFIYFLCMRSKKKQDSETAFIHIVKQNLMDVFFIFFRGGKISSLVEKVNEVKQDLRL